MHLCQDWAAFSIPRAHGNERNYDLLNKICQVGAEKAEVSRWLTLVSQVNLPREATPSALTSIYCSSFFLFAKIVPNVVILNNIILILIAFLKEIN